VYDDRAEGSPAIAAALAVMLRGESDRIDGSFIEKDVTPMASAIDMAVAHLQVLDTGPLTDEHG
jgi:hypothetical protein